MARATPTRYQQDVAKKRLEEAKLSGFCNQTSSDNHRLNRAQSVGDMPQHSTEIENCMGSLGMATNRLNNLTDELIKRLEPVINPNLGAETSATDCMARATPLGIRLNAQTYEIERACDKLSVLLNLIEL